jgi:FKBP-type peptidyl-prolyl cis-trans isomerase
MKRVIMIAMGLSLLSQPSWGEEVDPPLMDRKASESYSLGYEFGNNLKNQGIDLDVNVLTAAVRDALEGKKPALGPEGVRDALQQLRIKALARQEQSASDNAIRNLEKGRLYLEENKTKAGVKILPSGLQYKVLREGNGPSPKDSDMVSVHYRGTLIDGTEFDSSNSRGDAQSVQVQGVIPAWTEALQLMKVGSKWQIFVPSELAYGKRPFGRIPANSALIFELELISIETGNRPQ